MKIVRAGLYAIFAFAVLAHGTVEPWSEAILETGAAVLFVIWSVVIYRESNAKVHWSALNGWMLSFIGIGVAQLIFRATVYPFLTRAELLKLAAYFLIFFLTAQAFRQREHMVRLGWFLIFFCFAVSLLGIIQHFTADGKIYWFREPVSGGDTFGPYVNRNHFAGFVELVLPVALVPLVLGKVRRERWFVVGLFALLPMGALFLCASRGGLISFGAELGILILLMLLRRTRGKHVLGGGLVLLLAFLFVSWLGVKQVLDRFSSLQSLEVTTGKRASMRLDTWHIFLDHPWTGAGLGTLQTVFPAYETNYDGKVVNHTHNDYLEGLAETGIAGAFCAAGFLGVLFFVSLRQLLQRDKPFAAALHLSGFVGCSGFLVHSLADFNLHIPANALLFILAAHLATSEVVPSPSAEHPSQRFRQQA
jgi:O-antigen ligase